jgi:endonuclease G
MPARIASVLSDPRFRLAAARAGITPEMAAPAAEEIATLEDLEVERPAPAFEVPPELEAVVLLENRPALLIRKNRFEVPSAEAWAETLSAHRALIEARLPSVGRIEVDDGGGYWHAGTGWVIADRIIVTNRHVAQIFAGKQGAGGAFRVNFTGAPYRARIDFREEYQEADPFEVAVEEVLFLQEDDRLLPDIALLRLASHDGLPDPIPVLETPPGRDADIAVIGYPAYDPRYGLPAIEAARAIFGTVYDVKRLSPGRVMGEGGTSWFFSHDATTLGGNSGSVVLDVATGFAVGLHFSGSFREVNYAVRAAALLDAAAAHSVPVLVRRALPPAPVPAEAALEGFEEAEEEAPIASYAARGGYRADFLGDGLDAPPPLVTGAHAAEVLTFADPATGETTDTLKYTHFSVVMNAARRLCFYSAVNIDGASAVALPGKRPRWRFDPRIPRALQIKDECYGDERDGKFSRGHMTRREDPNWGGEAELANWDTFHAPNATPQIQPFNAGVWNNLEDYALQNAKQDRMRISVFTGPIFTEDDPKFFGVETPVRFWKVIAFVHDGTGRLCVTGYTMSQEGQLPGQEFVFGRFDTYQTALAEIEGLTGLSFGPLTALDPMGVVEEAAPMPLRALEDIRFV